MKLRVTALHGLSHGVTVADIAGEDFDAVADMGRRLLQPTPGAERIVLDKGANVGALQNQMFNQMGADKTPGAGH